MIYVVRITTKRGVSRRTEPLASDALGQRAYLHEVVIRTPVRARFHSVQTDNMN